MTNNSIDTGKPIETFNGGTTDATLTLNGVLYGQGAGPVAVTTAGTNGQLLLGSTGAAPAFATVTSPNGTIVFTPGPNSLGLDTSGSTANSFVTNAGVATPVAGVLNVFGGNNIGTTGAGNTVTINVNNTTNHAVQIGNATSSLTSIAVGATNTALLGSTGADPAFGAIPNGALTNNSITLNNGNNITVTGSPVALGGAATINVSGTINHAVQLGNVSGSLTSSNLGTNGEVLIGATGANPAFALLTSNDGSVVYTTGPNTLDLSVPGGSGPFSNGTPQYAAFWKSAPSTLVTPGPFNVNFDQVDYNFGTGWSNLNPGFRCLVAGVYIIYAEVFIYTAGTLINFTISLTTSTGFTFNGFYRYAQGASINVPIYVDVLQPFAIGDTFQVVITGDASGGSVYGFNGTPGVRYTNIFMYRIR